MIQLDTLTLRYGDVCALRDLSLRVEPGEKVAVIGPSGSGKSSLLRHLAEMHPEAAWIPQDLALVPQLGAFANVHAARLDRCSLVRNLRNLVWPHPEDLAAVRALFVALRLEDKLRARVGDLSGGEQQRVAIARAIHRDAPLVLADEPVSALDPTLAEEALSLLVQRSPTLLTSLHSVDLALRHATRVIGLREGQILFDLPSGDVAPELLAQLYRPA